MFATLLGALPRPLGPDGSALLDDDAAVDAALAAQAEAGIELRTDGRLRAVPADDDGAVTVRAWRAAAGRGGGLVKQAVLGPYSLARAGSAAGPDRPELERCGAAVRRRLHALADAGCPYLEVEEPDAWRIGGDAAAAAAFGAAHAELLAGLDGAGGPHLSLAITGGNADTAGLEPFLAAPYRSLAVDLIDGPDNWRLAVRFPGDRGLVCGVLSGREDSDDGPELRLWAAQYAAASMGRGLERVGLATAGSLAALAWPVAVAKLGRLGRAAAIASLPLEEAFEHIDPRAIDIRSAAFGRYIRPADRPRPARPDRPANGGAADEGG